MGLTAKAQGRKGSQGICLSVTWRPCALVAVKHKKAPPFSGRAYHKGKD